MRVNDNWLPACGGTERPFRSASGVWLLYVWQPSTGRHAYLDMGRDVVLTDEEAEAALGYTTGPQQANREATLEAALRADREAALGVVLAAVGAAFDSLLEGDPDRPTGAQQEPLGREKKDEGDQ